MLAIKYLKKIWSSPSGASTLYHASARPDSSAKSVIRVVLPDPALPLIMVAAQVLRLSLRRSSSRGLNTCKVLAGRVIFSRISCIAPGPGFVKFSMMSIVNSGSLIPVNLTSEAFAGEGSKFERRDFRSLQKSYGMTLEEFLSF